MSREGLDRLWRMYTTGELAKKLTEILSTDKRTIQSTIAESNYNQACGFFDELEKTQTQDEEYSIGMTDEEHKELGESSPAATASSSDPAEHSVERSAETKERLHTTTDGDDSSSMMEVEHKQLRKSSQATTSYSSDPAEHSRARWTKREEILHTITDEEDSSSMMEVDHKQLGESSKSMTASSSNPESCIKDKTLSIVARKLGREWLTLAVEELGFTMIDVKTIETNHPKDTIRRGLDMLTKWKQAQSTSVEQQITKLCTALKSIGRADIAGFLHGPDHLKICQQLLFSFYEEHTGFIQEIVTSSRSLALGVNEFNIDLNLLQSGHQTAREDVKMSGQTKSLNRPKTVPLDTWEDLYDEKKVGEKMVLLSGGAGSGKSTVCLTIANTWKKRKRSKVVKLRKGSKIAKLRKGSKIAKFRKGSKVTKLRKGSNVAKFELLFLLKLNQFKTSCIIDAIFDQLLQRTDKLTKSDLKKVISDNEDKVAFLMDGLDEIPRNILQSTEGVYTINDVMKNKVLLNSCVLVTTRPDMIPYVTKGYRGYARVETKGFTVVNRDKFIKAHFPYCITSGEALISCLESLCAFQELSQSPIIAHMICLLWRNRPNRSKPLSDKLTTVYTEFAEVLVKRRVSSLYRGADRQQVMDTILKGLGQVALEGLLDGERLHFSPEDFSRDESVLKDGCQMGILQTETVPSGVKSVEVVTFFHKSHQEYCAAYYLVSLVDSDEQSFRECLDKVIALGVKKVEYVFRYCCGLSERAADLILSRIREGNGSLARLCLLESGSKTLAFNLLEPGEISCEDHESLVALHYYLESGIKLKRTVFTIWYNSCADLRVLSDIIRCCKGDIQSMTIQCNLSAEGNEMLRLLVATLQTADWAFLRKKLIGITVLIHSRTDCDARRLSECISLLPNQLWTVYVYRLSHGDTCVLLRALTGCNLHGLWVIGVNMHGHIADLRALVTPSLKELWLSDCGLGDADAGDVVSLLSVGHGLTDIDLMDNAFSLDAVKTLARHCQALSKLSYLSFHSLCLDYDDVQQVIQQYVPQRKENRKRARGPFKCVSYEEVKQLTETLRSGDVVPTAQVLITYTMSERWREEMELLEETFGSLDERLRGQMELTVDVENESVVDVEWLAGCISRLSSQVDRFNLCMTGRSPSYVTGLLNALTEGCTLSGLKVDGTNMCMVM